MLIFYLNLLLTWVLMFWSWELDSQLDYFYLKQHLSTLVLTKQRTLKIELVCSCEMKALLLNCCVLSTNSRYLI